MILIKMNLHSHANLQLIVESHLSRRLIAIS